VIRQWAGFLVTALILGGVAAILLLNLESSPRKGRALAQPPKQAPVPAAQPPNLPPGEAPSLPAGETLIGEPVERNHMEIKAVWLPSIQMEGMPDPSSDVIHLEADVHATEGNPNGFGRGEFVPYLKIRYTITPAGGGAPILEGNMIPMVAKDGLHYGAIVAMPKPGMFNLTYEVQPPSEGGLGRHSDRATGVDPWWTAFRVAFSWDYEGPSATRR
jgi:uncharacterized protein involved in high-affinity Fe2+ transport